LSARSPNHTGQAVRATVRRRNRTKRRPSLRYGREDLIPEMFTQLVHGLERQFPGKLGTLRYYLDRHIELDGDEHGEMGRQMVDLLCKRDLHREPEATQAAVEAQFADQR